MRIIIRGNIWAYETSLTPGRLFICILIKGEIWGHTTSLTPPTFVLYAFNKPGK